MCDTLQLRGKCRRFGRTGCEWKSSYAAKAKECRVGESGGSNDALYLNDGDSMCRRNIRKFLPDDMTSLPRRRGKKVLHLRLFHMKEQPPFSKVANPDPEVKSCERVENAFLLSLSTMD